MLASNQIWANVGERIDPTLNLDWQAQDLATKPALHARKLGNLVVIEGALSKPTNVTTAGKTIAIFPESVRPNKIHSTGTFETYQGSTRREWRYQMLPTGELVASGQVATGRIVSQAYVNMTYYLG